MRRLFTLMALAVLAGTLSLGPIDADAKRLGGGSSVGRQRPTPTVVPRKATPDTPPTQQAAPAQPATGATPVPPATPAPQPGFWGRFGPALAGLGIGALFGSLLGGAGGTGLLMLLLVGVAGWLLMRSLGARRQSMGEPVPAGAGGAAPAGGFGTSGTQHQDTAAPGAAAGGPGNFGSGAGSSAANESSLRTGGLKFADDDRSGGPQSGASAAPAAGELPFAPDSPEAAALMRVAESAFIRLQAANDAGDLDDLRNAATPEVYAELAVQIRERGSVQQRTEVVQLKAVPVEMITEGEYLFMSVRYGGLIRETPGTEPQPFDEIWHLRRKAEDPHAPWLIAGIQQVG